jgi:aryl-alcohol dehydrogenase-like predicted oxidoreductase
MASLTLVLGINCMGLSALLKIYLGGFWMSITGYATLEGTMYYKNRFNAAENHFRFEKDLWISSIGIGTYLGDWDEETDRRYTESVVRAVRLGSNVIDTASNYRFQRSERSIGAAIKELIEDHGFSREEILVCTKGGYLPFDGAPPADIKRYVDETFIRPGIINYTDIVGGSHSMTPAYLQSQIDQSLKNMQLSTIDVYYIHNPESQLSAISRAEFEKRLHAAFERLEKNISEGKIRRYGVATWNGFRVSPDAKEYHSLERMVQIAREVGGENHGFGFIQLPVNLGMPEAIVVRNQTLEGREVSLLEAALALNILVVSSASILQKRLASGLPPEVRGLLGSLPTDAQTAIQFVRSTPAVTTALVGMSHVEHVEENLKLVEVEPISLDRYRQLFSMGSGQ